MSPWSRVFSVSAEPCSIAPVSTDEDPLLCPHGYVCHVTESGNSKKKSSKQGYCVKQADSQCKI